MTQLYQVAFFCQLNNCNTAEPYFIQPFLTVFITRVDDQFGLLVGKSGRLESPGMPSNWAGIIC